MGDTSNKEKKPSFFKGVKAEFGKISWPDKTTLTKETIAVVGVSVVAGLLITAIDAVLQIGINYLTM